MRMTLLTYGGRFLITKICLFCGNVAPREATHRSTAVTTISTAASNTGSSGTVSGRRPPAPLVMMGLAGCSRRIKLPATSVTHRHFELLAPTVRACPLDLPGYGG